MTSRGAIGMIARAAEVFLFCDSVLMRRSRRDPSRDSNSRADGRHVSNAPPACTLNRVATITLEVTAVISLAVVFAPAPRRRRCASALPRRSRR